MTQWKTSTLFNSKSNLCGPSVALSTVASLSFSFFPSSVVRLELQSAIYRRKKILGSLVHNAKPSRPVRIPWLPQTNENPSMCPVRVALMLLRLCTMRCGVIVDRWQGLWLCRSSRHRRCFHRFASPRSLAIPTKLSVGWRWWCKERFWLGSEAAVSKSTVLIAALRWQYRGQGELTHWPSLCKLETGTLSWIGEGPD
jgi:hypothetical protein